MKILLTNNSSNFNLNFKKKNIDFQNKTGKNLPFQEQDPKKNTK